MGCGNSVQVESRQAAVERRRASAALRQTDGKMSPAVTKHDDLPPIVETVIVLDYEELPPEPQHTFDPKAQPSQSSLKPSDSMTAGSSSAMAGSTGLRKRGISFLRSDCLTAANTTTASSSSLIVRSPLPRTSDDESPLRGGGGSITQQVTSSSTTSSLPQPQQPLRGKRRESGEQALSGQRLGEFDVVSGSTELFQPSAMGATSFATSTASTEDPSAHNPFESLPQGKPTDTDVDGGDAPPIASWIQHTQSDSEDDNELAAKPVTV